MTPSFVLFCFKRIKNLKISTPRGARFLSSKRSNGKATEISYEIVRPEQKNFDDFIELMWNTYFKEEPISKALGISKNKILTNCLYNALNNGHSFIAKTLDHGCVIGGCLNVVACPKDGDDLQEIACSVSDKKLRALLKFWSFIKKTPDLWTESKETKVFDMGQPFVHELERCKGIGKNLMCCSIERASECKYPLIRFVATGNVSACFAEKLRMKLIQEIPYQNYVGQDSKPVVEPTDSNNSVKIYISKPLEK